MCIYIYILIIILACFHIHKLDKLLARCLGGHHRATFVGIPGCAINAAGGKPTDKVRTFGAARFVDIWNTNYREWGNIIPKWGGVETINFSKLHTGVSLHRWWYGWWLLTASLECQVQDISVQAEGISAHMLIANKPVGASYLEIKDWWDDIMKII